MSVTAAAADAPAASPSRGKKKIILIGVVVLLLLGLAGGGATWYLMNKAAARAAAEAAEAAAEGGDAEHSPAKEKAERKGPPVFVVLDTFTVNLVDREVDRYAQIGITLEVEDPQVADQLKLYMPAIRHNILMVLTHKTSAELLEREGKRRLADEMLREAVRALGGGDAGEKAHGGDIPVRAVHFSSFIIQ